jgi:hypothetical protein
MYVVENISVYEPRGTVSTFYSFTATPVWRSKNRTDDNVGLCFCANNLMLLVHDVLFSRVTL